MGSSSSTANNSQSYLFIETCRTEDIEQVRQLLPSLTHKTINFTDKDGNTGLHIACIQDNYDLVFLILQSDIGKTFCSRTILNKQGLNAYECAQSKRVRSLFTRPASTDNRFIDTNTRTNPFEKRQVSYTRSNQSQIAVPNNHTCGYKNEQNAVDAQFILAISRAPWLIRRLFQLRTQPEACEAVQNLIARTITDKKASDECMINFNSFIKTKNAEHLLTLYTNHTTLCKVLQEENNAFTTLLYLYLNTIANRAYGPGDTFRGMTFLNCAQYQAAINEYRWAKQNDDYVLETRVLQSTSRNRETAEFYIVAYRPENQPSFAILCHYQFPDKCCTALDIQKLSKFSDEEEVLILPFTLFKVINIEVKSSDYHIISLMNVPVPEKSFIRS